MATTVVHLVVGTFSFGMSTLRSRKCVCLILTFSFERYSAYICTYVYNHNRNRLCCWYCSLPIYYSMVRTVFVYNKCKAWGCMHACMHACSSIIISAQIKWWYTQAANSIQFNSFSTLLSKKKEDVPVVVVVVFGFSLFFYGQARGSSEDDIIIIIIIIIGRGCFVLFCFILFCFDPRRYPWGTK